MVVRISSGLGNQMFQYALCCVFREKGIAVKADLSMFMKKKEQRAYELEKVFGIKMPLASSLEIAFTKTTSKILYKLFNKPYKEYNDDFGIYNEAVTRRRSGYINGYWQSEKYFKPVEDVIRKEFNFPPPADQNNADMLEQIRSSDSVGIHIRRTDYVNGFNWGLNASYYFEAIKLMESKVNKAQFYFFSDDINWVRDNFRSDNFHFIDFNDGENSFRDMQLMSNCKHQVIANSTFSWWGAWLNTSPVKIVIAPGSWLPHINGTRDIIPGDWIRLPVTLGK